MTGFEHMPSAGLDPEEPLFTPEALRALEAEADLPGGWGPEDVRRFDDHRIMRAYPPHAPASIMTTDGFKTVRPMPRGAFDLWVEKMSEEARQAYNAHAIATVVSDLLTEGTPCQPFAASGRVVDDNPVRDGRLFQIKSLALRRAATVVMTVCAMVWVGFLCVVALSLALVAGLVRGLDDLGQSVGAAVGCEVRNIRRSARVIVEAHKLGWRR